MLIVTAQITSKKGCEELTKSELLSLIPPTLKEEGCIKYELHTSMKDPCSFLFYEIWTSKEALEKHSKSEHLRAFRERRDAYLAEPPIVQWWESIK